MSCLISGGCFLFYHKIPAFMSSSISSFVGCMLNPSTVEAYGVKHLDNDEVQVNHRHGEITVMI